ncbi:MAG: hypothetical protein HND48_00560 [Chloroflexi bacterium]|nr:hypothetical protein [Chloroflexota bacterium]
MSASRPKTPSSRIAEGHFARYQPSNRATFAALGVLALFVILALSSAVATPLFEASDEAAHFLYAHSLAETGAPPCHPHAPTSTRPPPPGMSSRSGRSSRTSPRCITRWPPC